MIDSTTTSAIDRDAISKVIAALNDIGSAVNNMDCIYDVLETMADVQNRVAAAVERQTQALEKIASLVTTDQWGEKCIKIWGRSADV